MHERFSCRPRLSASVRPTADGRANGSANEPRWLRPPAAVEPADRTDGPAGHGSPADPLCREAIGFGGIMKSAKATPLNGPHKELFADGGLSGEGRVKNGKRHGKWTWYYKNCGLKAVGKYADGELDGFWEWWRENGKPLQAGSFNCGQQVGPWKRYYENGQLWDEGMYEGGKKVGEWKVYDKSGELKQTKVFKLKK
jgi:antitoxin component YwqK of YwqJK toxin-antitoxin module